MNAADERRETRRCLMTAKISPCFPESSKQTQKCHVASFFVLLSLKLTLLFSFPLMLALKSRDLKGGGGDKEMKQEG